MHYLTFNFDISIRFIQRRDNQELRQRFGDNIPDVAEIAKKISLTFVNQHYSYTGPKPLSNQLIEIGGIHIKPDKPIPQVSRSLGYFSEDRIENLNTHKMEQNNN